VQNGANTETKDTLMGQTPLHVAAMQDRKEVAALLLTNSADTEAKDESGQTPLHLAVKYGRKTDVAELLLAHSADVNAKDKFGMTPLYLVAQDGYKEDVAELLLAYGADVNAKANNGDSPVKAAATSAYSSVKALLLARPEVTAENMRVAKAALERRQAESNPHRYDKLFESTLQTLRGLRQSMDDTIAEHEHSLWSEGPSPPKPEVPPTGTTPPQAPQHQAPPRIWTVPVGDGVIFPAGAAKAQSLITEWGTRGGGKTAPGVVWDLAAREANAHRYDVAGELFRFFYDWLSKHNQAPDLQLTVAAASAVCLSRAHREDWPPSRGYFPDATPRKRSVEAGDRELGYCNVYCARGASAVTDAHRRTGR
jgi:hypothetical protein